MNDNHPLISVIIPTFNRANYLRESLESLTHQSLPQEYFEVIVIDDASTPETRTVCESFQTTLPLKYHRLGTNSGISAAKNLGVFRASGDIVFFFDDDDAADKELLGEHLKTHLEHPEEHIAVLGYTTWSQMLKVTQVMNYITEIGQFLFSYPNLKQGQELGAQYFWGGRSSCKRSLLVQHGVFNQAFRFGSEDIELGYRLLKFGLKVIYNKRAVSYMIRPITYDEFCRRCERQGLSQVYFSKLHAEPEVQKYCQVNDAKEKWEYVRQSLDQKIAQVHEIESFVYSVPRSDKAGMAKAMSLLPRLGDLYWWTFNAFKLKGIVQAMEEYNQAQTPSPSFVPAPSDDVEYIREKWSRLNLPSKCAGNVLVIDPTLPWFDRAAGSLRLFHILLSLRRLGYHVTYIARNPAHADQYVPILQQAGIEVYAGDPTALATLGDKEIYPNLDIEKVITSRQYDLAILSFWDIAGYYMPLVRKHSPATKIVVDTVDIHFVRELRQAELKNDKKEKAAALARKERELAVYKQADRLWVVTEEDKKAIEPYVGGIPFDIIPTIHPKVDVQKAFDKTSNLLFVGNFNHTPNRDALLFFCREIWPRIKKQLAGVKLYVVGNDPPKEIWALASESIVVKGYVPDLASYLNQARVSVVPLRYGAGIKGKIGEALSWGLPVVCTSIAAEGMKLQHGRDVLIADRPEKFAEEVVRLYTTSALWNSLSKNGKVKVQQEWSPEVIGTRLEEVLRVVAPSRADKTASIILLTHNQWKYTRQCLESLRKHTDARHEIIAIDNASTDETLQGLVEYPEVRVIRNKENVGFPAGVNQGMNAALGEYIVLLNNDTVVTDGWLERLVEVAESETLIGIVGPVSNSVSGPQQDNNVTYKEIERMPDYAAKVRREHRGETLQIPRVAFLCTLIKRKLIETIGGLDERFTPGNFEDDDFCLRAQLAGFKTVVAKDVFIHHYGSRSFGAGGQDAYAKRIETNRRVFIEKWDADPVQIWNEGKAFRKRSPLYPLNKDSFVQHFERAKLLIQEKELTLALVALKNAAAHFHSSERQGYSVTYPDVLNLTGNVALMLNDLDTAAECFKKESDLTPDSERARAGMENVRNAQAIPPVSREAGEAIQNTMDPLAADPRVQQVLSYAVLFSHSGHLPDAVKVLHEAISAFPGNATLYGTLAWLLIQHKMFDDASALIESTPDNIKKSIEWLEIAGYCTEGQGFDNVASQCVDKALALAPNSARALTLKGILAAKTGDDDKARKLFAQAIEQAEDMAAPNLHLGVLLWQNGEREEGCKFLERAFVLESTDGETAVTYYRAAETLGKLDEAEVLFQKASETYPVHKQLRHFVADVLARQGKYAEAMNAIEDAITLFGPDGDILPFAREIRKELGTKEIRRPNGEHETVSLCMILKNEEQSLARCLSSVKNLVDEMIVVDTGSTDKTKEIAEAFGARVFEFAWTGSFSDARNFSLSKAHGDWILVLDGDEVISLSDREGLKKTIASSRKKKRAFSFTTRNYVEPTDTQGWMRNDGACREEAGTGWIPSVKVRLFPRLSSIQFHGAVHEMVEPTLAGARIEVSSIDIPIHHYGKLDDVRSRSKGESYLELGKTKLEETGPKDIKALSELAIQENELGNYQHALEICLRLVELDPQNSRAHMGVGANFTGLGRFNEALEPLKTSIRLDPDLKEAYIRCSIVLLLLGRASEAIPLMKQLLKRDSAYPYSNAMLAAVLLCSGAKADGLELIGVMESERVAFDVFFADLARQLRSNGRTDYAIALLEPLYESEKITQELALLLVECYKVRTLVTQKESP